ncbi:MAG: T9SS C-terminal target domain-containing protein [Haliscomenobacteraceae bacterium CHB4]|nr:T9SS C-terminal target domain-containing protein [Haliscomenobacteraceae bacterium CHB4]
MKKFILHFLLLYAAQSFAQNSNFTLRSQFTFPNEKISGVWGYEKAGREYALVAGAKNLHIVEVTDPDVPSHIVSLPMTDDWGKEVRTFQHVAYVCAESGPGLVIYDLSALPDTLPASYPKKEINYAGGKQTRGHTLHVDTAAGVLYLNDGGTVRLVSPEVDLRGFQQPDLHFQFWCSLLDTSLRFSVFIENETIRKEIWSRNKFAYVWTPSGTIALPEEVKSGNWRIVFEAKDTTSGFDQSFLEVGLDAVEIRDGQPTPALPIETLQAEVFPNPFHERLFVRCLLPERQLPAQWRLFDVAGRQVLSGQIDSEAAVLELIPTLASGVYFFYIQQDESQGKTIKVVKL